MEIIKKRIGKDIAVSWPILTNGEELPLAGRDLLLEVKDKFGHVIRPDFSFEVNVLHFVLRAHELKATGLYTFVLWENYKQPGQSTVDIRVLEIVPLTADENPDPVDLESGNLEIGVPGRDATINGFNVVEIIGGEGTIVTMTEEGDKGVLTVVGKPGKDGADGKDGGVLYPSFGINEEGHLVANVPETEADLRVELQDGHLILEV